jgi:hypothetical protein
MSPNDDERDPVSGEGVGEDLGEINPASEPAPSGAVMVCQRCHATAPAPAGVAAMSCTHCSVGTMVLQRAASHEEREQ